jgi:2,4-dienoyl-CoA reductase-like NADH-dependent reductase (Old Yellow Enzyme family)
MTNGTVQSKLFAPGRIGPVEMRNRVVMPPMTTRLADAQGYVTDATVAYFRARAAGGVGLVTVEMASPEKVGRHRARELGIFDDRFLPGLKRLVDAIHSAGAKASIQLGHGGGHTRADICGEPPIAPSAIPHFVFEVTGATIVPIEMTRERIAESTRAFIAAAVRARQAGFDCVEIHVAHGYLLSQFLCPEENRRTDEYGGSLENRARFALEVTRGIKRAVPDAGVIFRLSVDDLFPAGMPLQEGLQVVQWAEQAGADAIHVSAGHYRSIPSAQVMTPPMAYPDALFLGYAEQVKAVVGVPVIAVGRLGDPAIAMSVVDDGKADFVALGRTLIADPEWVNKVAAGTAIRPCLACNTCVNEMRGGAPLGCVVNAAAARELEFAAAAPLVDKRIAVVGAGPAGLTYAHLAAGASKVVVFEREARVGGAFRYAGKATLFQEVVANERSFARYLEQMERGCRERGVEFRFNADVDRNPSLLDSFDHVVIATGARYRFGLGGLTFWLLEAGLGRARIVKWAFASQMVRDWFYYRARKGTGETMRRRLGTRQELIVIGDAARAGKSKEAVAQAFRAALLPTGR